MLNEELLEKAINQPKETINVSNSLKEKKKKGKKDTHSFLQWIQINNEIEKLVNGFQSLSSNQNQDIHHIVQSFSRLDLIEKLIEFIKIDSDLFFHSSRNFSKDDIKNNEDILKEIHLLTLKIRFISFLIDLIHILFFHQDQDQSLQERNLDQLGINFISISHLIYRLSAWYSVGYSIDEWDLAVDLKDEIHSAIERLWKLVPKLKRIDSKNEKTNFEKKNEIEYGYLILNDLIKPFFMKQNSFSNQINLKTGRIKRTKQDHLLAPTINSSVDLCNNQIWKIHAIGFWNSICLLLEWLDQDPGIQEIWPLLIPPIITLLEETQPRYRLRGLQLSIGLLKNAPPRLICQTGINDLLQKSFSNTFGLLNIQETIILLNASFEANVKLIQVEWNSSLTKNLKDQENQYKKIDQLFHQSILNSLIFRKSHLNFDGQHQFSSYHFDLLNFVVTSFTQLTDLLHFAIGRYVRIIMPYLIESLINFKKLNEENYKLVIKINQLIQLLFENCGEVLMEWGSRLVVVFACCWKDWQQSDDDNRLENFPTDHIKKEVRLSESTIQSIKKSIIEHVFKSFIRVKNFSSSDDHHHQQQQEQHTQGEEKHGISREELDDKHQIQLSNLIFSIHQHHPVLSELFNPFL